MSIIFYKLIVILAAGIQGLVVHAFLGQELIRFELLNKTRLGANSFLVYVSKRQHDVPLHLESRRQEIIFSASCANIPGTQE